MFWIVVLAVIAVLLLVFFDSVREHPLGTMLLVSTSVYFIWRSYSFLMGEAVPSDDTLIWRILGGTAVMIVVVGVAGALIMRKKDK